MDRKTLSVAGMSCDGCERNVETALRTLGGIRRVEADHTSDSVEIVVVDDADEEAIHATIEQAGYDVSA